MAKESEVGPWARDKLDRLKRYLTEYTRIMRRQDWCEAFIYVDAFAGSGRHRIRDEYAPGRRLQERDLAGQRLFDVYEEILADEGQQTYIDGSPRAALDIEHPFTHYIFVDSDSRRVEQLNELRVERPDRSIHVRSGDCNAYRIDQLVNNPDIDWKKWRAVVFLDPYGMHVPWSTLEAIAQTKAIEVFVNFPLGMAIQRFLRRDKSAISSEDQERLDLYFGTSDWSSVAYAATRQTRIEFEDEGDAEAQPEKLDQSGLHLLQWYRERLATIFKKVTQASLITNTAGGHLYYLMLATHNQIGYKIANHILTR